MSNITRPAICGVKYDFPGQLRSELQLWSERGLNSEPMRPYTRRQFTSLALSALPAAGFLFATRQLFAAAAGTKPDSKFAGVQVGLNVPYSFANATMSGDDILKNCVQLGLSAVELRTQPVEAFLGAPAAPKAGVPAEPGAPTIRQWRESAPVDKARDFRKTYDEAGVQIGMLMKVDGLFKMSDGELDYAFNLAKTLGAHAISTEISKNETELKRVGGFADKHQLLVGYHGHTATGPEDWKKPSPSRNTTAPMWTSATSSQATSARRSGFHHRAPRPRHTRPHQGPEEGQRPEHSAKGEGDTPIAEVLRLIRDNANGRSRPRSNSNTKSRPVRIV